MTTINIDLPQPDGARDRDYPPAMADGLACVVCGLDYLSPAAKGVPHVPVGRCAETGSQVFACTSCCGEE